jgi:hypothetical protein
MWLNATWQPVHRLSAAVVLVVLAGCGPARAPTKPLPEALVLRIDTVEVSPTRANTHEPWDAPAAQANPAAGCNVIAAGATFFEPAVGGVVSAVCALGDGPKLGRVATEPDLQVSLGAGTSRYSSFAVPDTSSQSLQYEFVVPIDAIPADGLRLEVSDEDQEGPELIGSIRLTSAQLVKGYESPSKLVVLSGGSIKRLELVVSAYSEEPVSVTPRAAKAPLFRFKRPVKAGELVSVRASGTFKVGSYYDETLDPAGYPGGEARSYNLGPFKRDPHGCAVALIGASPTLEGVAVGAGKDFIAAHAGPLRLGLNDKDLDNNQGTVSFQVALRAPTAQEWLKGGQPK